MSTRPPATTNTEIIVAVATLTAQLSALQEGQGRIASQVTELKNDMRADLATINATVGGHTAQIADWKRDGKWLGTALVGLGAMAAFFAAVAKDWFLHVVTK